PSAVACLPVCPDCHRRYIVRAPIRGTILQVNIRVGEHATPASIIPPIVLGSIDELQIRADVDEQSAPRIRLNAKAVAYKKSIAGFQKIQAIRKGDAYAR
ncbi:MAG: hypothetical protein H8M99_07030, partial [Gloeobacteraceae cyanobacterium ES-bin-144]|nr:hypothetical protein [Verrucomicrobiales bacterium]